MSNKTPIRLDDATESAHSRKPLHLVIGVILLLFGTLAIFNGIRGLTDNKQRLYTPNGSIIIELVDTPEARQQGLSGRESIADSEGMMFIFDTLSLQNCFWMKDMQFSIDMIWLNEDKSVVTVIDNVDPDTYPERFCPSETAKYGLEVGAGRAAELEIVAGTTLKF